MSQNWTSEQYQSYLQRQNGVKTGQGAIPTPKPSKETSEGEKRGRTQKNGIPAHCNGKRETETEKRAERLIQRIFGTGALIRYDGNGGGTEIELPGGHRYTPDFTVWQVGAGARISAVVEAKGSYRLQSQGRSALAFATASTMPGYRCIPFLWAKETKGGGWAVGFYLNGQRTGTAKFDERSQE